MNATSSQLRTVVLGDPPDAWRAAGFHVEGDTMVLGRTTFRLTGSGHGFEGWSIDGVPDPVDGLPTVPPSTVEASAAEHPNGITGIDHVVVITGDQQRTIDAFTAAGLEVRGGRSTTSYGSPMRQTFFWAGDVIIELVGPDEGEPTTDDAPAIFGFAFVAADLDATAERLGPLLGAPKPAVQPGRRIAGFRHRDAGMRLPVAVMSPHVPDRR